MKEGKPCPNCEEENRAGSWDGHNDGSSLPGQSHMDQEGRTSPRLRGGWKAKLLILAGLIAALAGGSIAWAARVHRHNASTYGIADPSSAALRIENRTSDFAITRVSFEGAAQGEAVRDVYGEIAVDAEAVLEIAPGTYLVKVFYVEIKQAVAGRPKGFLSESFSVSPGKAAVLCFQGGRSSPEGMVFIPPKLALK